MLLASTSGKQSNQAHHCWRWQGLTKRVNGFVSKYTLHWAPLFYHQHRLAHLPHVYADAHKFHHYLHGTTQLPLLLIILPANILLLPLPDSNAFDAHLYGSGAPEEWHCMMLEALPALYCGIPPASLSPYVLYVTSSALVLHGQC